MFDAFLILSYWLYLRIHCEANLLLIDLNSQEVKLYQVYE